MRRFPRLLALSLLSLLPAACASAPQDTSASRIVGSSTISVANGTITVLAPVNTRPPGVTITYGSDASGLDLSSLKIHGVDGTFHVEGQEIVNGQRKKVTIGDAGSPSALSVVFGSQGHSLELSIDGEALFTETFDTWFSAPPNAVSASYGGASAGGREEFIVLVSVRGTTGKFTVFQD